MKCLVCNKKENVLEFNKTSLKKCLLMLMYRRKKQYKYGDLLSALESMEDFGYHSNCLKKITVLKNKEKPEFEEFCKTVPSLPSSLHEQSTSTMRCNFKEPGSSYVRPTAVFIDEQQNTNEFLPISKFEVDDENSHEELNTFLSIDKFEEDDEQFHSSNKLSETTPEQVISLMTNKKTTCLFCDHVQKTSGKRRTNVTFTQSEATVEKIREIAEKSHDTILLAKLEGLQSVAYHSNCLSSYYTSWKRQNEPKPEPGYWHKNRELHHLTFDAVSEIIKEEILEKKGVMYLSDLLSHHKALLLEFGDGLSAEDFQDYRVENLERKILSVFGEVITVESSMGKYRKKIIHRYDMDVSQLANEVGMLESSKKNQLRDVAYGLRNSIASFVNRKPADDHENGDFDDIPEDLFHFVSNLVQGPDTRRKSSREDIVKIKSVCSDLIILVSQSRVKPKDEISYTGDDQDNNNFEESCNDME